MPTENPVERIANQVKAHRVVYSVLLAAAVIVGVANVLDSFETLGRWIGTKAPATPSAESSPEPPRQQMPQPPQKQERQAAKPDQAQTPAEHPAVEPIEQGGKSLKEVQEAQRRFQETSERASLDQEAIAEPPIARQKPVFETADNKPSPLGCRYVLFEPFEKRQPMGLTFIIGSRDARRTEPELQRAFILVIKDYPDGYQRFRINLTGTDMPVTEGRLQLAPQYSLYVPSRWTNTPMQTLNKAATPDQISSYFKLNDVALPKCSDRPSGLSWVN